MKLSAEFSGSSHVILIERDGARLCAQVDERSYEFALQEFSAGSFLLIDGAEIHDCRVGTSAEHPQQFTVNLRSSVYEVTIADPKRLRRGQSAASQQHGLAQIMATMPGKVVRVLVEEGAIVEPGTGIVVVEAMKMQNEMKAPKAGMVAKLNVAVGETVNAGDVLAIIE